MKRERTFYINVKVQNILEAYTIMYNFSIFILQRLSAKWKNNKTFYENIQNFYVQTREKGKLGFFGVSIVFSSTINRISKIKRRNLRSTVKYRTYLFLLLECLEVITERALDLMSTSIFYESKNISSGTMILFLPLVSLI